MRLACLPDTLEDWWDDYQRSLRRRGRSAQTAAVYERAYGRFWRWALSEGVPADPAAVTPATVNRWLDRLQGEVARTTVVILWRNVRPFFAWWARETDLPNPFEKADLPSAPTALVPVVPLEDLRTLLAACQGKDFAARRDTAMVLVLAGLRGSPR